MDGHALNRWTAAVVFADGDVIELAGAGDFTHGMAEQGNIRWPERSPGDQR